HKHTRGPPHGGPFASAPVPSNKPEPAAGAQPDPARRDVGRSAQSLEAPRVGPSSPTSSAQRGKGRAATRRAPALVRIPSPRGGLHRHRNTARNLGRSPRSLARHWSARKPALPVFGLRKPVGANAPVSALRIGGAASRLVTPSTLAPPWLPATAPPK